MGTRALRWPHSGGGSGGAPGAAQAPRDWGAPGVEELRPPGGLTPEVVATADLSAPEGSTVSTRATGLLSSGGGGGVRGGGPGGARAGLRRRNDGGGSGVAPRGLRRPAGSAPVVWARGTGERRR
ncbi:hypothetical protein GCM10023175_49480 [Pseudonocardia xishanensis]|uniref:Uncharacterized protein n=1 Tax=Pseudonocardia xishanensis TaxID=630995 RepID=A0ABP8RZ39_9PSEU